MLHMHSKLVHPPSFEPIAVTHLGTLSCLADMKNQPERALVERLLEGAGASINSENVTALDLSALPEDTSLKYLKEVLKAQLGIERLDKKSLEQVNLVLGEVKEFLLDELHLQMPKEIQNQSNFKNWEEVVSFLERAKAFRKAGKANLAPYYCGVAKAMRAIWEFHKHGFENMQKEGEYFYDQLFQADAAGTQHFHKTHHDAEWDTLGIHTSNNSWISDVKASFRGKGDFRWFSKLIRKPELDADEVSDALGLRFEIKNISDAEKIAPFLIQFLADKRVSQITIENKNLLHVDQIKRLMATSKNLPLGGCDIHFESDENLASSSCYADLKLTGHINMPEGGKTGAMEHARSFEIQLVLVDNKNEKGFAHHAIYEAKQKLSVVSRLFGPFNEKYFNLICAEAAEHTGMNQKKIKTHLLEGTVHKVASNVQGSTVRFVARDQFDRQSKAGFVSFEVDQH